MPALRRSVFARADAGSANAAAVETETDLSAELKDVLSRVKPKASLLTLALFTSGSKEDCSIRS